jgi:hypothetical protein
VEIRATAEISVISPETATHKHKTVILEMVSMVPHTTHSNITLNKNFHIYRKDCEQNPFTGTSKWCGTYHHAGIYFSVIPHKQIEYK